MIVTNSKRMRKVGAPVPPHVAAIAAEQIRQRIAAQAAQAEQREAAGVALFPDPVIQRRRRIRRGVA